MPMSHALSRTRATTAQFDLDRAARATNLGGAFHVADVAAIAGRWVVLVDDVVTTGSTLAACAAALLDGGASAVSAVAVARER
jgi:predicted amidophosphoribosyltransferase